MAQTDPRTTEVTPVTLLDEVVGNRDGSTVRQPVLDLATQLAAAGPIAAQLANIPALQAAQTGLDGRMTAVEGIATSGAVPKGSAATVALTNIALTGVQTVAGVATDSAEALAKGVLVTGQSAPAENGVWIPGAGAWTRRTDLDAAAEFTKASVRVDGGTYAGHTYWQTATVTTLGTDAVVWAMIADDSALASVVAALAGEVVDLTSPQTISGAKTFSGPVIAADLAVPYSGGVNVGGQSMTAVDGNWRWGAVGATRRPIVAVGEDGDVHFASGQSSFEVLMASRNAANLAVRDAVMGAHNDLVPHFSKDAGLLLAAGQSLAAGAQGFPALTRTPRAGCKMIGQSVRASYTGSDPTVFVGIGGNVLTDLIATTDSGSWPRTVLSQAAEAALAPSAGNDGEAFVVSATHRLADQIERRGRFLPELVAINCAVGSKTISELSDGASPNYYGQIPSGIAAFKSLEDAASRSSEVVAVLFAQGEDDYADGTTKADYKAGLATWWTKVKADAMSATGQTVPPALIMYQASQYGDLDAAQMSIGMAQFEFALETEGVYMVGPVYQYPQKTNHLTANGYRWFGNQTAKVLARVLLDRRGWRPLSPLWTEQVGDRFFVGFHVPVPPLRWGSPYRFYTAQDPDASVSKGFRISDDDGFVPVSGVRILNDTVVEITCSTLPGANPKVWMGQASFGDGFLRDSDRYRSDDRYEYDADSGQAVAENIAALVDEPYDLGNWCINFCLDDTWSLT